MKQVLERTTGGFLYPCRLDKGFENLKKPLRINHLRNRPLSKPRVFQWFEVSVSLEGATPLSLAFKVARGNPIGR